MGPPSSAPSGMDGVSRTGLAYTHRTPSLRMKSSWSGSPLRWKTAITPLWILWVERSLVTQRRRASYFPPGLPSPTYPVPSSPTQTLLKSWACPHPALQVWAPDTDSGSPKPARHPAGPGIQPGQNFPSFRHVLNPPSWARDWGPSISLLSFLPLCPGPDFASTPQASSPVAEPP